MSNTKLIKWEKGDVNEILEGEDGFYISYNPGSKITMTQFQVDHTIKELGKLLGMDRNFDHGAETALRGKDGLWYVLRGDFRKEYEEAFPDYEKCLGVYQKHKEKYQSGFSTDYI